MFLLNVAKAATDIESSSAGILLKKVVSVVVNPIIILFFIMAISVFVFGVFEFIKGADNPEAREKGRWHIMAGIIGLLIMTAVFSIIRLLLNTFGIDVPFILG